MLATRLIITDVEQGRPTAFARHKSSECETQRILTVEDCSVIGPGQSTNFFLAQPMKSPIRSLIDLYGYVI